MNKFLPCFAVLLAAASPAMAKGVFDGTWKEDVKASQPSTKPSVVALDKGMYSCTTCVPAFTVPADGAYHAIPGNPYVDALAITVVDAKTIRRAMRKGGKMVGEATVTVSADGKTMTTAFNDMTAPNGVPVTGTSVSTRVAAGPVGSHATSGAWRETTQGSVSESGLVYTMAQDGRMLSFGTPTGVGYTTTIDGPASPVTGDPGWTSVMVKQTGPNMLAETDMRDGKPIATMTMTVSPDGKKMTVAIDDILYGKKSSYVAFKQ